MTAELSRDQTLVWAAKLPDYFTNELLQGSDIEHDFGHFNPFPTHDEFDNSVDEWDVKGVLSFYQLGTSNS